MLPSSFMASSATTRFSTGTLVQSLRWRRTAAACWRVVPSGFSHQQHLKQKRSCGGGGRRSEVVEAKRGKKGSGKSDNHSAVPKMDEAIGPFPESVLLKKKSAREDGRVLPEFADAEEEELFEFLSLQLESDLNVERVRHYEVVYLIHEDRVDEVENVISKVQGREKAEYGG